VFFYLALRDGHLIPSDIEVLLEEMPEYADSTFTFTNGWLARYAINIVGRLRAERRARPEPESFDPDDMPF
jgi:hypothetical protein